MNTTLTLAREQIHPPIALTHKGLVDRAAIWCGIALIRWARRSELQRSQRLAHQAERAARQHDIDRLRVELDAQRTKVDAYIMFVH